MATIQHNALTTTNLHEPKGAGTATANTVYLADGAGSGSWQALNPHAGWRYSDIGTGTTFTTPTTYTLMTMTTVESASPLNMSTNNAGRITYTGTPTRHLHAVADLSYKHSTGGGQDVFFALYKNGTILTQGGVDVEAVGTADSGNYQRMVLHFDSMVVTNDYFEIYLKTAAGNVIVHTAYMFMMGMPA